MAARSTVVVITAQVFAATVTIGLPWPTGTLLTILTVPATALAIRVATQPIAVALGRSEGRRDAVQAEDAAKGRRSDSFEGLTP
jgi:hypothetical protein